jgi:hypothetical protein
MWLENVLSLNFQKISKTSDLWSKTGLYYKMDYGEIILFQVGLIQLYFISIKFQINLKL